MNSKFPGPCDDIKWGRTELWDMFEAAHVLVDIEPSTDPDPYFEPEADALYKQLSMSVAVGYPKIVQQIGNRHLFLPLQMVDWALKKGYPVSGVLQDEVCKTARMHIDRANAEKSARKSAIDLAIWQAKDLWSEDELGALLCGFVPSHRAASDQARRAVQLGILAGKLEAIHIQIPGSWEHMHADQRTDRYFKPANAIEWANGRRTEFPDFPDFSMPPIPSNFADLAPTESAPLGIVQAIVSTTPAENDAAIKGRCASSATVEDQLSDLFDPVKHEALEKMFPSDGEWQNWAERASRNGLKTARTTRGLFNPYRAALWFLQQGKPGWDLARCNRVLANNLPARSRHEGHQFVRD